VVELAWLKQENSLGKYLKFFDNILDIVMVSEDIAFDFCPIRFQTRMGKIGALPYTIYHSRSCSVSSFTRRGVTRIDQENTRVSLGSRIKIITPNLGSSHN